MQADRRGLPPPSADPRDRGFDRVPPGSSNPARVAAEATSRNGSTAVRDPKGPRAGSGMAWVDRRPPIVGLKMPNHAGGAIADLPRNGLAVTTSATGPVTPDLTRCLLIGAGESTPEHAFEIV